MDVDRLDHLMNLAGELIINKAQFLGNSPATWKRPVPGEDDRHLGRGNVERLEQQHGLDNFAGRPVAGLGRRPVGRRVPPLPRRFSGCPRPVRPAPAGAREHPALRPRRSTSWPRDQQPAEGVLDTRMVPIGPLFERLRRVVRDIASTGARTSTSACPARRPVFDKRMDRRASSATR
ncbi:MAG: hypothetical protein U0800_11065 [Isosphaeraceae bacterium]